MKLGVAGTGMIVQTFAPHFAAWGASVAAVYGRAEEKAQAISAICGGAVFTDYAEMLDQAPIDTVYIGLPNDLHYAYAKQALKAGKHVVLEKPITACIEEAEELAALARAHGLLLYEAVSTLYLPNYRRVRESLPRIGAVKVVTANYSQYSSRYDRFQTGDVAPAFDPAHAGGAFMDLGLYNMQYIMGIFGEPAAANYQANIERGIDTSGICALDYGSFKAVSIAAKDCGAPSRVVIQGTKGYILQNGPSNGCSPVLLHLNDGTEESFDENPQLQWESEWQSFDQGISAHDAQGCYRMLEHSLAVSRVMTNARRAAGVRFPADEAWA